MDRAERLVPDWPLPPYAHVPGRTPHPVRDPAGHMHDAPPERVDFAVDRWRHCRHYLYGIDLFNHGYYWEAHEAWEQVWIAAGRRGVVADFLKTLIKLAAAGVKRREGIPNGQRRHARRAAQLLQQVATAISETSNDDRRLLGLSLDALAACAAAAAETADLPADASGGPTRVFSCRLEPRLP